MMPTMDMVAFATCQGGPGPPEWECYGVQHLEGRKWHTLTILLWLNGQSKVADGMPSVRAWLT